MRILATSREPLAVAGEARYRLAPLALPDLDDLAGAARAEAVALFADRARGADAHFALDDQTAPGPFTLDAEDATMRQVLGWAVGHDPAVAPRIAVALAPWWFMRGRLAGQYGLLRAVAERADAGSDRWCAAQRWLGYAALVTANQEGALGHFTALRDAVADRPPSRSRADGLAGRSTALLNLGRIAEGAEDGRRGLAVAREVGYPAGEALALGNLSYAASDAGDPIGAVELARQAQQIQADLPGMVARTVSTVLTEALIAAGDPTAAEGVCAEGLVRCRDAGDLSNQGLLLTSMAMLDLQAARVEDAAAHLRENLQAALRTDNGNDMFNSLDCCGYLVTLVAQGHPDRIGQLASENHRHMLAQASRRQLLHQDDRPTTRTPGLAGRMTRRLAAAIARASVVTAQAQGRSQ